MPTRSIPNWPPERPAHLTDARTRTLIGDVFTPAPRAPALPPNRNGVPCSGRFQLIDHETGKPVAGRRVRVWSSGGWNAFDTTDADGMTSWIERPTAEILYIDLVQRCDA